MNKSKLVELRNNLISKNNFDKDKIDEYIEKCEEKQTEFMNKRSFNLYKYDNIILNNLLDMIHYFLFKKSTQKKLNEICYMYQIEIFNLKKEIENRSKQIEKIDNKLYEYKK